MKKSKKFNQFSWLIVIIISISASQINCNFLKRTKNESIYSNVSSSNITIANSSEMKKENTLENHLKKMNITGYKNESELHSNHSQNTIMINQEYCNFKNLFKNLSESKLENNITHVLITHKTDTNETSNKNTSEIIENPLTIIADQTELIKKEICLHCLEISDALNILIAEIKIIKQKIGSLDTNKEKVEKKNLYFQISQLINSVNYIKADLFKLNEILNTLHKVDCPNFSENSKKYELVVNYTNKLVEKMQTWSKSLNLNLNLVILT